MSLAMDSEFRGDYLHLGLLLKMKIKEDMKRQVVVFDFDGTLTTCDTFGNIRRIRKDYRKTMNSPFF